MDITGTAFALATSPSGTPTWLTPVIAAGAAILAAAVTAAASAYAARRKVAELALSNSFDLAKRYLESARNYTQTVYLPLAASVYKLYNEFLTFTAADPQEPRASELAESKFISECRAFIYDTDKLFRSGAGAVLTSRLDESLTFFVSFLRESLTTERVIKTSFILRNLLKTGRSLLAAIMPVVGIGSPVLSALIGVGDIQSRSTYEIAAAPVTSDEFEKQFMIYIDTIKAGIREVTLGGYKPTP